MMPSSRPCELRGCGAIPSLAARRGLAISVDTRWRVSKDGIAKVTHSAASRLLSGSNAGSAATKPLSAKHVGKGELDNDASARFSRQLSAGSTSVGFSRQVSTGSSACAGSASALPPHDWSVDSQTLRCLINEQSKPNIQQRAKIGLR